MDEQKLRDLANELRAELPNLTGDHEENLRTTAGIEGALALPHGQAKDALRDALRARPETRQWVAERTGGDDEDDVRGIGGPPNLLGLTAALGVHLVCPNGDYDRFAESPDWDPGRCPTHALKLVRAPD